MAVHEDLAVQNWSVREALAALAAGRITASDYVEALLQWQAGWPRLNAYVAQNLAAVRAAAARSDTLARETATLAGLPIVVKDNIDLAGYATTDGTPGLRDHHPRVTAPLLQGLIDRGVIVLGKTGLHELAAGGTCANLMFGVIRNPYNQELVPGGSSGGTAAAVAARLVPAGLGTDTAGSVRAPAAHCGCVGFRPTTGRYDRTGMVPGTSRRDTIGWFARSVADVELLDAFSGHAPAPAAPVQLKGLRLGVPRAHFYESIHPSVEPVITAALRRLERAGAVLIEADIADAGRLTERISRAIRREFPSDLAVYLRYNNSTITAEQVIRSIADPQLRRAFEASLTAPDSDGPEYREALEVGLPALQQAYARCFDTHRLAALVVPTCPDPPYAVPPDPAAGGTGPLSMIRNTEPATHAGLPSLSVPAGLTADGLPVGIQFDGPPGADLTLLRIGKCFEAITDALPAPVPH